MRRLMAMAGVALMLGPGPARAQPAAAPVDYAAPAAWACRPGVDPGSGPGQAGTCSAGLDATVIDAGGTRTPQPYRPAAAPPIDCFYIYPTASNDATPYSDLALDAGEKRAIHGQAARLGSRCRLFVPAYRQLTLAGLRAMPQGGGDADLNRIFDPAYRDVLAAWRAYLARDNHGRGVVLVGHSQGAILLRRLLAEEVDGKPAQRRLVGAYLAGNVDLDMGSLPHIPPCRAMGQTGCVVGWSSYLAGYDGPRVFGHAGAGRQPLCVNPAALGGGRGTLKTYLSTPPSAPAGSPPYLELTGALTAECVADGKGAVLRVTIVPGAEAAFLGRAFALYSPRPTWGLHTFDISLVQGNMLDLIAAQSAAWGKR